VLLLVTSIEIARLRFREPPVPDYLRQDYFAALAGLPALLANQIQSADELSLRVALAANAAVAKQPLIARAILDMTPAVLRQYEAQDGWPE
jgi:hypothetical protein